MLYIIIGVIFEIYWAWGLKHAVGDFWGIASIALSLMISFYCLIQACKTLEVSIAYAIYTGLGASGLVIIDMFSLGFDVTKFSLICLLLAGIIGIKLSNQPSKGQIK
ncbi:DMT family transporter [Helicobacter pametensis]|uniref:DMT family transporter n=1 Tax=Helicobacter pametensis TaxID=95149 RepID=UPI0004B95F48|nr:SMR family transporter [Helicobacter pametensis]